MENVNLNAKKPFALSAFFATAINTIILFVFASRAVYFYMDFRENFYWYDPDLTKAEEDYELHSFLYCEQNGNNINIMSYFAAAFSAIALLLVFIAIINVFRLNADKYRAILVATCIFNIVSFATYITSYAMAMNSMKTFSTDNGHAFNLFVIGIISSALSLMATVIAVLNGKKYQAGYGNVKASLTVPVFVSFLCTTMLFVYSLRAGYYFLYEKFVKTIREYTFSQFGNIVDASIPGGPYSDKGMIASFVYNYEDLNKIARPRAYLSAIIALMGFILIVLVVIKANCMTKKYAGMAGVYFILNICSLAMLIISRISSMKVLREDNIVKEITFTHTFGYSDVCLIFCILNVVAGAFAIMKLNEMLRSCSVDGQK